MRILVWIYLAALVIGVFVMAGRPDTQWSEHRRALRALRRIYHHKEKT